MIILTPVLLVLAISMIFGLILSIASIVMFVPNDEKIDDVTAVLPGANCGACGYSGCFDYAVALVNNNAAMTLCAPGGVAATADIARILGKKNAKFVHSTAVVHCIADSNINPKKIVYHGIESCSAVSQVFGTISNCEYGCIGFGDCVKVCNYDAISICNGIAVINTALCKSCAKCVTACPKHIISIEKANTTAVIRCSNNDRGNVAKSKCSLCCIGCKLCLKACPSNAITVENNLAVIDSSKCTACKKCISVCPKKCISILKINPNN